MTSRASLKLFLCTVLFSDNISVLKVYYSKSFVYNAFNDFAGYSPHPFFYMFCKKGYKNIAKHSISEDQSTEETGKIGTTVQCI